LGALRCRLVLWEAQFGDFVNGAQIILDQFLAAGETKWFRQCGLALLLPHGYEGQGPEHSSARIERFLQVRRPRARQRPRVMDGAHGACAGVCVRAARPPKNPSAHTPRAHVPPSLRPPQAVADQENVVPPMAEEIRMQIQQTNMQVLNVTTPANYFHALRRQVHRGFRKPLVIATPKSLLRHKAAVSTLGDMSDGSGFQRFMPDAHAGLVAPKKVRKLLLCSGKVYYDLDKHRADTAAAGGTAGAASDVAIARVEQIAPFPFDAVAAEVARFPNAQVVWAQEEPRNMGAWAYVAPRIMSATRVLLGKEVSPTYAGRLAAASPAAGSTKVHEAEHARLLADAFA